MQTLLFLFFWIFQRTVLGVDKINLQGTRNNP